MDLLQRPSDPEDSFLGTLLDSYFGKKTNINEVLRSYTQALKDSLTYVEVKLTREDGTINAHHVPFIFEEDTHVDG